MSCINEIKEAIILAAGSSKRMGELCENKSKCMLSYGDETILERLIRQLKENGIEKIVVVVGYKKERIIECVKGVEIVENDLYEDDVNIYSMKLALEKINGSCVIFEADTIMEDSLIQYVVGSDFEGNSVWFTRGLFNKTQYGGILKSDKFGNIIDIKYVPEYKEEYRDYTKLTGLMKIGPHDIDLFKRLIDGYASKSINQYYLIPWIENLRYLSCVEGNAEYYTFGTFNNPEDFIKIFSTKFDQSQSEEDIELIDVKKLKPIEKFNEARVEMLMETFRTETVWTQPLYIEKDNNLVLDGHHRLQIALRLGLRYVPVVKFKYEDVKVWTLRKEQQVDIPTVIERANKGDIYPYKTVKHKFPTQARECKFNLERLK